jgi:uncharacterized membrane protein
MSLEGPEIRNYLHKVVEEVSRARGLFSVDQHKTPISHSSFPAIPSIDKSLLARVVALMISKKPYLREEDKQMLDFLVSKEGSAFESEIRNKLVLPRTSLWRLIKRLERDELVEVRKIGGQNLIKLRFEKSS